MPHRGAVALADARRAHAGHQDSAAGIDEQVALDAADLRAAVVPVQAAALAGPDALTVHDGRAASGITADLRPLAFAQRRQHPLPHALLLPSPPVVVDGVPRRQVMRQHPCTVRVDLASGYDASERGARLREAIQGSCARRDSGRSAMWTTSRSA